jgi:enoyl-CoA hydratase/carnithine racemase
MAILKLEKSGTVAVLKMNNKENKHNLTFAREFLGFIDKEVEDESFKSLVITSTDDKNWSQGLDLDWMKQIEKEGDFESLTEFLKSMDEIFNRLLLYPLPVIAAINGHAFGNGAVWACACDFRFMKSDRGFFCFPEVDLNIDFVPGAFAFIEAKLPRPIFNELILLGKRATALDLVESGVIEKACKNEEELLKDVIYFAQSFQKCRDIFRKLKKKLNGPAVEVSVKENLAF